MTVPQVKTKSIAKPRKTSAASTIAPQRPTLTDARELITTMMDYEAAARAQGINPASGRFEMLTASERQFYRAELIADYIRISAGNMGNTQGYYDAALQDFCNKVCDMRIASHELIGTYLAAVDIVASEESLNSIPALNEAVRHTMISVLQHCVDLMRHKTQPAAA
ncbi:MAG: hypothetical protein M1133_07435 [Armatimonadetes bacterium]|nr:hypothetical protein [Armatimonadota bacterium]